MGGVLLVQIGLLVPLFTDIMYSHRCVTPILTIFSDHLSDYQEIYVIFFNKAVKQLTPEINQCMISRGFLLIK